MKRIAVAALLLLAAGPALAADAAWKAAWYQVEIFPEVKYGDEPYDYKQECELDLKPSHDMLVVCAHLTKPADALDAAIATFGDMIKKQPKADVLINQRGNLYMQKGDTTDAIADYTRAMKLKPDNFWPYVLRATAYEKAGKRDKAIADYKAALTRHPTGDTLKQVQDALKELGVES
jgi:tetratricopeptide (TPR) repeat protein